MTSEPEPQEGTQPGEPVDDLSVEDSPTRSLAIGKTASKDSPAEHLTDSPWFWGYIFATAALIGLALAAPKYKLRQTQLERRFLARQEGGQTIRGEAGQTIEKPTGDNLILRLGPLFLIVGSLLVVAWSRFWWTRVATRWSRPKDEVKHLDQEET